MNSRLVNEIVLISSILTNIYEWIRSKKLLKCSIDVFEISCYLYQIKLWGKDDDGTMERGGEEHATQDMDYTNEVYIKYSFQNHELLYCFLFIC